MSFKRPFARSICHNLRVPTTVPVDAPFRLDIGLARGVASSLGTPLYVLSEAALRERIRRYRRAFEAAYPDCALAYASKANSTFAVLGIAHSEGCLIDAASEGELRAALGAGVPATACDMHGNDKTVAEIAFALEAGARTIVIDNFDEIAKIGTLYRAGMPTRFVLRLAPGVDPVTHEKIATGRVDTKFGFNISDGSAERALLACREAGLPLAGFHCHVGSQLLDPSAQIAGGEALAHFAGQMLARHGFRAEELNVGGGLGIRYTESDAPLPVEEYCRRLVGPLKEVLDAHGLKPRLLQEPGRSLVGECGVTLYEVGAVKTVPAPGGTKKYVVVDGGLSDNPRPGLYGAQYRVEKVGGSEKKSPCTVAGKHCETDVLFHNVELSEDVAPGDLIQVLCTGAYNSSMASNYNRYPRPATALIPSLGEARLVQRRESWDAMFSREVWG